MKTYNSAKPFIFIHVPKSGGISVKNQFRKWFGKNLHEHYFNEALGRPPERTRLTTLFLRPRPLVVYGHFNSNRGFGVEDYYPEVDQFVTVLRDPFETAVSGYFYTRKTGDDWKEQPLSARQDIRSYLIQCQPNILNHFPRKVTSDNYRDIIDRYFIATGITERMDESLHLISRRLGMPEPAGGVERLNATTRTSESYEDLRPDFESRHPLEFQVYRYCNQLLDEQLEALDKRHSGTSAGSFR